MGMRLRLLTGALLLGMLLFWTGDELSAGRGGGRGGGGPRGGVGGGRPTGAYGGARPMPSPRPMPAQRPSPGFGGPTTGPGIANRPSNVPSYGGGIGTPQFGIAVGGTGSPAQLPSFGNGAGVGGGGNVGSIGAGRPGTGPDGPARPGIGSGAGRPGTGDSRPGIAAGRPGTGAGRPGIGGGPIDGGLGSVNRGAVAGNRGGTVNVSRNNLVNQGNRIRNNFNHWDCFHGNWWNRYPGCWRSRWWTTAAIVWALPTWDACYTYCGYPPEPIYYDYGSNVVYQGDSVYVNSEPVATTDVYASQAEGIAQNGREAQVSEDGEWLPLGVFAMAQEGGTVSNNLFQFAVNKDGVLRGNYYNGLNDSTTPLYGSVDKKTQRAAWTVGDKKNVTYEAGFANLTKNETTMLVHFGKDKTQQWTLVRMEQPKDGD